MPPRFSIRMFFGSLSVPAMLLLGLYWSGLAALGLMHGGEMYLPILPVAPENAATWLAIVGGSAVVWSLLAIRDSSLSRLPLFVWSIGLALAMLAAVFRSEFSFDGLEGLRWHGLLLLGSLLLMVASWIHMHGRPSDYY